MWYLSIFDSKPGATQADIRREREEWIKLGKDKVFQQRCKTVQRYEAVGSSPLKIVFIVETDDPIALNMLSSHFGDAWNSITYPIVQRQIYEALEDDNTIIAG